MPQIFSLVASDWIFLWSEMDDLSKHFQYAAQWAEFLGKHNLFFPLCSHTAAAEVDRISRRERGRAHFVCFNASDVGFVLQTHLLDMQMLWTVCWVWNAKTKKGGGSGWRMCLIRVSAIFLHCTGCRDWINWKHGALRDEWIWGSRNINCVSCTNLTSSHHHRPSSHLEWPADDTNAET